MGKSWKHSPEEQEQDEDVHCHHTYCLLLRLTSAQQNMKTENNRFTVLLWEQGIREGNLDVVFLRDLRKKRKGCSVDPAVKPLENGGIL